MKKDTHKIILSRNDGEIAFEGKITSLQLKEELILKKSIEFFDDCSPCYIHRSAVMKRLFVELEDFLIRQSASGITEWNRGELPPDLAIILEAYEDFGKLKFKLVS